MFKVSSKEKEALKIVFSQGNFNSDEIEEITESFSKIVPVEQWYRVRMSAEILPAVLIFSIGFIVGSIGRGFFEAIGSDLYRKAKEKAIGILKNKESPTLKFEMLYGGTKISITCQTRDERELNEVFDTVDKARDIAINELDKEETPEINELMIYYDQGWTLDAGRCWKPPRVIKFYRFDKKTGKWELTDDWSER